MNIEIGQALQVAEIARQAGDEIMAIYATNFAIDIKGASVHVR